jgi:hypothetical protein
LGRFSLSSRKARYPFSRPADGLLKGCALLFLTGVNVTLSMLNVTAVDASTPVNVSVTVASLTAPRILPGTANVTVFMTAPDGGVLNSTTFEIEQGLFFTNMLLPLSGLWNASAEIRMLTNNATYTLPNVAFVLGTSGAKF